MTILKYVLGVLAILVSLFLFGFFAYALLAVGVSGTNQSQGESNFTMAVFFSGIPFGLGCLLFYSAYKNQTGEK